MTKTINPRKVKNRINNKYVTDSTIWSVDETFLRATLLFSLLSILKPGQSSDDYCSQNQSKIATISNYIHLL